MIFTCPRTGRTIDLTGMLPATAERIRASLSNPQCSSDTVLLFADWLDFVCLENQSSSDVLANYTRIAGCLRDIAPAYAGEVRNDDPLV